jgi:hypothetical protein
MQPAFPHWLPHGSELRGDQPIDATLSERGTINKPILVAS